MMESRTAQLDNELNMASREREIVTRLGHEPYSVLKGSMWLAAPLPLQRHFL